MITKQLFKEYLNHECPKLVWVLYHEHDHIYLLKKIINKHLNEELEEVDDYLESLFEIIRMHPEESKRILDDQMDDNDFISSLIFEMNNTNEVSAFSREWFINQYTVDTVKRADTIDGSIDGEIIYNQNLIEFKTKQLLEDPTVQVILEGQLSVEGLVSRWDGLVKHDTGYRLYEVKGSNNIKKDHIYDVFFQYHVYKKYGLNIEDVSILHINNEFDSGTFRSRLYPMNFVHVNEFFKETKDYHNRIDYNILDYLKAHCSELESKIQEIQTIIKLPKEPESHVMYDCKKGSKCILLNDCHELTSNHIFNLTCDRSGGGKHEVVKSLLDQGITTMTEINEAHLSQFPVKRDHHKYSLARYQIENAKGNIKETNTIKCDLIKKELLKYDVSKLVFFDFESASYPIPIFQNSKPWEQVTTQYSMHVLDRDYDLTKHDFNSHEKTGDIQHFEYIGHPLNDLINNPDLMLIEQLIHDFEESNIDWKSDDFKMVVYNKSYEIGRFKNLKDKYPHYTEFITSCIDHIIDLRTFFINGWWCRADFNGKTSLKVIQKAFINDPEIQKHYKDVKDFYFNLDYSQGPITNGSVALEAYQSLQRKALLGSVSIKEQFEVLEGLKYYCKIDTWSTVIIYDLLKRSIKNLIS